MFAEWLIKGKPSLLGVVSGAVAGLVAITPACRLRRPDGRDRARPRRRRGLPVLLLGGQEHARLRRLARRVRRALRRRHRRRARHRHPGQSRRSAAPASSTTPPARSPTTTSSRRSSRSARRWSTTLVWSGVGSLILFKIVDIIVGLRVAGDKEREGLDSPTTASAPTICKRQQARAAGRNTRHRPSPIGGPGRRTGAFLFARSARLLPAGQMPMVNRTLTCRS